MGTPLPPAKFKPLIPNLGTLIKPEASNKEIELLTRLLNKHTNGLISDGQPGRNLAHDILISWRAEAFEDEKSKENFITIVVNGKELLWDKTVALTYRSILEMSGAPHGDWGCKVKIEVNNHTPSCPFNIIDGEQFMPKPGCRALVTITWPK